MGVGLNCLLSFNLLPLLHISKEEQANQSSLPRIPFPVGFSGPVLQQALHLESREEIKVIWGGGRCGTRGWTWGVKPWCGEFLKNHLHLRLLGRHGLAQILVLGHFTTALMLPNCLCEFSDPFSPGTFNSCTCISVLVGVGGRRGSSV